MCDHSQKVESARFFRIDTADEPVEALGVDATAGAMMSNRSGERLFGTAPGIHDDIPTARGVTSVARPITPKAKVYLTGAAVDPDWLIAGQRARRPVHRVTCNV